MTALPWHKRNHRDAIEGYMGLTLEERGAYTTILDLIYDRGGPLPDNERLIAGYLEISTRRYRSLRDALIEKGKIIRLEDGSLMNNRAAAELESAAFDHRKSRESGAKGGRKRVENAKKANENNEGDQAPLEPPSSYRDRDKSSVPKGTGAEPPIDPLKVLFDEGVSLLVATGVKPGQARSMIGKWRNAHAVGAVIDAVREARDRRIDQPIEWIGPYLARKAKGGEHGAGESLADFLENKRHRESQAAARRAELEQMRADAVPPEEAAALIARLRAARKVASVQ